MLTGNNVILEGVYLFNNELTTLDLSQNPNVKYLNVEHNRLTTLPTLQHPLLTILIAGYNDLALVDLTQNDRLLKVKLEHNHLAAISVANIRNLSWLKVSNNQLSSLDLSHNSILTWLECDSNRINRLDVSKNPNLQWIAAENNHLTELDLSANQKVEGLSLQGNEFSVEAINNLITQLKDVSSVTINENNRAWARILNIAMPNAEKANIAAARDKGWTVITVTTGISTPSVMPDEAQPLYYVTPAGIVSKYPTKGLNIIRYSNGTTRKVIF